MRSHSRKWPLRDWQPLYHVGCEDLICLCMCVGLERDLLLDWYLGSQKLREILTLLLLHHPPLRGKPTQAQDVARRISGAVVGESTQKVNIPSTHHNPYLSHYIICHLHLIFLSPTSPLPFYSPSLSQSPPLFPVCLFPLPCCFLVCWITCCHGAR